MVLSKRSYRRLAALLAILSLTAPGRGVLAQTNPPSDAKTDKTKPVGTEIRGKVYRSDGKTVVPKAVVTAYLLETGEVFASTPTGQNGEFAITGLPYGYAELSVETSDGVFAGNQVVGLAPGGKLSVSFNLTTYGEKSPSWWGEREPRELPGTGKKPVGVAEIRSRARGREFWKSAGGVATLAGIGGGLLLILAAGGGGGGSSTASPSTP